MTRAAILLILVLGSMNLGAVFGQQIVITPEETDEILANPGIGWETFHQTSRQDKNLQLWIPSTLQYARWGWGELEPEPGKLNTTFLDRVLEETHASGQKLAFRVMCCSTTYNAPYHPKWLKALGGRELLAAYGSSSFPIPDLDDPIVLKAHLDFIRQLGARYDGHPDIDHIDIGSIGWWGEWHLTGSNRNRLPALENRIKVVGAYLAAFKKTPLLMLIGGGECLKYACDRGTGWRADCLGDMGGFSRSWCHMRQGYPGWIQQANLYEVWKSAPVAWETCWDMRKWVEEGWSLRYIFNYALACHASVINNKSAPLPQGTDVRPETERFLRRLGYRLVLKELKHSAQVKAGGKLELAMKWQNTGSAPCYRPYRVAVRLSSKSGFTETILSDVVVNRWLPGSIDLFTPEFFREPKDLPRGEIATVSAQFLTRGSEIPGEYALSIAVVDAARKKPLPAAANARGIAALSVDDAKGAWKPVLRLGIQGRAEDGWYPLSKVQVVK